MTHPEDDAALERDAGDNNARDDAQLRRTLRKVDFRLIPLLFVTYMLNFMDKTILSSASVFGLIDDTHLVGQQYSWVSSIFYFGYFFWEYPTNFLIARVPVAKYIAFNTFFWGAVVALTAACVNYGGLLAVRFLLGVAEATITPAFIISKARFLTREERELMTDRAVIAGTGRTEKTVWRWDHTIECLIDPKTWHVFALAILTQIPNGGTQNFSNLVIKSFGFTSLQSTLINIPASVVSMVSIALTGYLAGHYRQVNCILIVVVVALAMAGSALIYARSHVPKGGQLFGYFLLETGPAVLPLVMSLVQANFRGVTKKMTVTAMMFIAYCAGNIAGPQFFKTSEAPLYPTAFRAILICYIISAILAMTMRFYLQFINTKRDREEGIQGSAGFSGIVAGGKVTELNNKHYVVNAVKNVALEPEDYDDVTDWKTFGFRYRL
ncbi:hypothetical protein MPDQ_005325 [Monascus purpureus]|uniref:Major facilitator superfamily (MFS) profile domain-containing protein n=1 Tax=Monascus purpureus TaxID=5098 RepID=A0A507QWM6_MONPU|nr:hypothetical protein MPDQ_005325 [Monascus purpureus]